MSNQFVSEDDKALFRRTVATSKPVCKDNQESLQSPYQANNITAKSASTHSLSDNFQHEVYTESTLAYCSANTPTKRLQALKKGAIAWQGRLDLHGLNKDAARDRLVQFINQELALNHRCLLIIHGKGNRYNSSPVLKNLVNHWLPQFSEVLAFHSAQPRDGGNGALYVLLRAIRI